MVAGVEEGTLESTRTVVVAPPSPTSQMSGDHKKVKNNQMDFKYSLNLFDHWSYKKYRDELKGLGSPFYCVFPTKIQVNLKA